MVGCQLERMRDAAWHIIYATLLLGSEHIQFIAKTMLIRRGPQPLRFFFPPHEGVTN